MTTWQKAIKYVAMAFAVLLIVSIVGNALRLVASFTLLFGNNNTTKDLENLTFGGAAENLVVEVNAADFEIKSGEAFGIETNNKNIIVREKSGTLIITEKKRLWSGITKGSQLVITLPDDLVLNKADIKTGAGKLNIEELAADKLNLELGAGEVNIKSLTALEKSEIQGGAGKITISDGELTELDFEMGIGELNLTTKLQQDCEINAGISDANITLLGSDKDYCIEIEKGIGKALVDGEEMRNGNIYGTGRTEVEISGGIGEIKVDFKSEVTE